MHLAPSWRHLGAILAILEAILAVLEASWGPLGAILGASWAVMGPSWRLLGRSWWNKVSVYESKLDINLPYQFQTIAANLYTLIAGAIKGFLSSLPGALLKGS